MRKLNPLTNQIEESTDPLENLEDVGYDGIKDIDEGYLKAEAYLANSEPVPAKSQAKLLEEYRALSRKPAVIGPDNEPVLGNDLLAKQDAAVNQEVEDAAAFEASLPDDSTSEMPPIDSLLPEEAQVVSPPSNFKKQQDLLSEYKNLLNQKNTNNTLLNISRSLGSAADAITISGGGTPVKSGIEDTISKQNDQVVSDYLNSSKALDVENETQMNDPESDISKFARENAVAYARKAGLDEKVVSQLEGLSAKQLEKLGFKAQVSSAKARVIDKNIVNPQTGKIESILFDEQGNPIKNLGEAGYSYSPNTDAVTGLTRMISKSNPSATPTFVNSTVSTAQPVKSTQQSPTTETGSALAPQAALEPEEYKTPTTLNKINPNLYKEFKKEQDSFTKDLKEVREATSAVTNLNQKLKPGKNKIDSGLLGGIQTQAAKLAGQKGVLTDQDLVKFAGAGGVPAGTSRFFSGNFEGEMTEQDIKFFKEFANNMSKAIDQDITDRSQIFVKNVHNEAKDYLPGLSEKSVSGWFNVGAAAPAVQKEMVKIISPDGKSGSIPKANLEKALKQGYKKVEENVK